MPAELNLQYPAGVLFCEKNIIGLADVYSFIKERTPVLNFFSGCEILTRS